LVRNILNTTSNNQVESWIADAEASGTWLILVYHNIVNSPNTYDTTPSRLAAHLDAAVAADVDVITVADGLVRVGA